MATAAPERTAALARRETFVHEDGALAEGLMYTPRPLALPGAADTRARFSMKGQIVLRWLRRARYGDAGKYCRKPPARSLGFGYDSPRSKLAVRCNGVRQADSGFMAS